MTYNNIGVYMYIVKIRLCHLDDNVTDDLTKTSVPGMRTLLSSCWSGKSKNLPNNVGDYCCPPPPRIGSKFLLLKTPYTSDRTWEN